MLNKNMNAVLENIKKRKTTAIFIAALILGGGYYADKAYFGANTAATRYVLAKAEKGTLVVSVSGTGQVSATNQADIKAKVSGDIVLINVKNGDNVKSGALLFQLDDTAAQKSIRDAEVNLASAKLALDKLKQPADALSVLQAQNALTQAQESEQNAQDDLQKSYDDGFNAVENAFLNLPSIMAGLYDTLFASTINNNQANINYYADSAAGYDNKILQYKQSVQDSYQTARTAYDKNYSDYKAASRFSDTATVESLINETYDAAKNIAEAIKNTNNFIQFYEDTFKTRNMKQNPAADAAITALNTYTGQINAHLQNLLAAKGAIETYKQNINGAKRTIADKTASFAKLKAGPDPLDIQSQELSINQRKNALSDAKSSLADYYIRAPFDGVVTKITNRKGDSLSSGAVAAALLTEQKIATITLNEVDVTKANVGQKATLTFDAIDDLSIIGSVAEIDSIGTISQGVVTYNVKIVFGTEDDRVKSGMSVSAAIITDVRQNVVLVPNAAVKQQGGASYVETASGNILNYSGSSGIALASTPRNQAVETGLSNDTMTEIISGLNEGDNVITRTITAASSATAATQSSAGGIRIPGLTGGGGGMRMGN